MTVAQLGLDGMPKRLFTATPTKLTTWLDCPKRYELTYIDKVPKGPPWAHNSLGLSVHNALRDWFLLPVAERTVDAAAAAVRGDWIDLGYRDAEQSAGWQERATTMVTDYVRTLDPTDEPIGIERTVALRTQTLALSGRADRIDVRSSVDGGEELVVVDYKTGRHLLSTDDARSSLALAVYARASERTLRRRCRKVELHHLPSGQVIAWEYDDGALERHLARAEGIAAEIAATEEFAPRPGVMCGYCDVVRECESGRQELGGVMRAPWDVLERWLADETGS